MLALSVGRRQNELVRDAIETLSGAMEVRSSSDNRIRRMAPLSMDDRQEMELLDV
jgi:hypothetical protein